MSSKQILVPLVTPLTPEGNVCADSVGRLMQFLHPHVDGFVPCLTSGEGWELSQTQWRDMLRYCFGNANGKTVIAGIEKPTTGEVITYAESAAELGVNAIMITAPFKKNLNQHQLFDHFVDVHNNTGLDIYIYYESVLCGSQLELERLIRLCHLPRVVGIKESTGTSDIVRHLQTIQECNVRLYHGWEDKLLQYESDGCIVSYSNLDPELCSAVINGRDLMDNQRLIKNCQEQGLFLPDWYRAVKKALRARGTIQCDLTVNDSIKRLQDDNAQATIPA